ncbi:Lysophospholipid acyltransferase, partial [hydrothermal vent metagenome]
RFDVRFNNLDVLDKYIDAKQGCLLLGTHLGSFEVLRTLAVSNKTLPLKITMYAKHNQMITDLLDALNPDIAKTVIDLADDDVLFQTQDALEKGFFVGMLGDRVIGNGKTTQCTLLGSPVDIPLGPLTLASIFKVPVILFFGLYQGKNRYDIYFEELTTSVTSSRKERDKVVQQWTQQYVDRIEYYMKNSPYNWFNFYDYWKDGKSQ